MDHTTRLQEWENEWATTMGAFVPEEGRVWFRDQDLHRDLDAESWMGLLAFGVTGRRFSVEQLELFSGLWKLAVSYPDPRLWNNRIGALAGTTRSTANLGMTAGLAISDATLFGHRPDVGAFEFLLRAQRALDSGLELDTIVMKELQDNRGIFGYGRPVRSRDERLEPAMKLAQRLGLADGPYTKLAFEVEHILIAHRRRMYMNSASLNAALCADQGLSSREYYYLTLPGFIIGILCCHLDATEHPPGAFFPFRCERIDYSGPAPRRWPAANASPNAGGP